MIVERITEFSEDASYMLELDAVPSSGNSAVYRFSALPWFSELIQNRKAVITKEGTQAFEGVLVGNNVTVFMTGIESLDAFTSGGHLDWFCDGQRCPMNFQVFRPSAYDGQINEKICKELDWLFSIPMEAEKRSAMLALVSEKLRWLSEVGTIASQHEPFIVINGVDVRDTVRNITGQFSANGVLLFESGYNTSIAQSMLGGKVPESAFLTGLR